MYIYALYLENRYKNKKWEIWEKKVGLIVCVKHLNLTGSTLFDHSLTLSPGCLFL